MKPYWLPIVFLGASCTTTAPATDTVADPVVNDVETSEIVATTETVVLPEAVPTTKLFDTDDLIDLDSSYNFSVEIPAGWEVENVAEIQSINFYDPTAEGDTNLDKSQIFVRYFLAQEFLTLSTVTIHASTELSINGHDAVEYDIEKKSSVDNFPSQPSWRNQRHLVTDIRVSTNSLVFYVFGQRPGIDAAVRDEFFQTLDIVE